ncbi:YihY/virulence factor BrkB family protein [Xanthobacter autotrophicus]|uniref:YihY/virulence factor BrkB family protein n=1 Tax=Xanthobacter TaxID=279 RepID=UPI0024AB6824|nr:YihY/virulence factor BrkB family protein [Xanthobacter autotrophicus]MDI4666518.1 YihY/virulence factor BrkB family protein [Xanthobacter autotrophicus]
MLRRIIHITLDAFWTFAADDGWAIASHIALSALMSLFPFLIFVTALAGFLNLQPLANETIQLILETWPQQVAGPISREIYSVVNQVRTDVLTYGVVLAIYFSSNGIESLRIGLNRAYGVKEMRSWYWLRLESIGYVLLAAVSMLALSFLVVLGPLIWQAAVAQVPALKPFSGAITLIRFGATSIILVVSLVVAHLWLPAGRRSLAEVAPGILVTLVLWLVAATTFGFYLAEFPANYVTTYAGLASVMIALVFLYLTASIFVFGGELNAAIKRAFCGAPAAAGTDAGATPAPAEAKQ